MKLKVTEIVYTGILACLVLIGSYINIMLPFGSQGGLVHFGTTVAIIAVLVCGRKVGTLAGAIGMTMFDILGGWIVWAPATLIARIGFGYLLGTIAFNKDRQGKSLNYNLLGIIVGGIWLVVIYYLNEAILFSNWITPLNAIIGDSLQLVIGSIVGLPISIILKKYIRFS